VILAGDIGGTKTDLAIFDSDLRLMTRRHYESRHHASLDDIVRLFLSDRRTEVQYACFGVAGPVQGDSVKTTNLPWTVVGSALARMLGVKTVRLINDLEATAFGAGVLTNADTVVLHEGTPGIAGNAAVIAAGTGLGEAGLFWNGRGHQPYSSEGGHATFAPANDLEVELLRHLALQFGHVSFERVLSGPGLVNLYAFLRDSGRHLEPPWLADAMRAGDPPAVISGSALDGTSELCTASLDLFASVYGSEAGNLALKMAATGGIYVAGGIAPKIVEWLNRGTFMRAFLNKGRMRPFLETIPVTVVMNPLVNLLGAARAARRGTAASPA